MNGTGALAGKEATDATGLSYGAPSEVVPATGEGLAGRTLLSRASSLLNIAPVRRRPQAQPSARDGVWFNTAQPPDDPETSWPSTVLRPFAADCDEPVVRAGLPAAEVTELPESDSVYGWADNPDNPADPDGNRVLIARRRHGRHAAPSAGIGSRLARKLAANR
jgi:hypothetical protein